MSQQTYSVLVTGGAGYLGSILVPALIAEGYRVTVLDNFLFGQAPLNQLCADPKFDVHHGDAREEGVLKPLLKSATLSFPWRLWWARGSATWTGLERRPLIGMRF